MSGWVGQYRCRCRVTTQMLLYVSTLSNMCVQSYEPYFDQTLIVLLVGLVLESTGPWIDISFTEMYADSPK